MTNSPSGQSFQALEAIAELLLWAGWDRAADEIYACIYGADADDCTVIPFRSKQEPSIQDKVSRLNEKLSRSGLL